MSTLILVLPGVLAVAAFVLYQQRSLEGALGRVHATGHGPIDDAGDAEWPDVVASLVTEPELLPSGPPRRIGFVDRMAQLTAAGDEMLRPLGLVTHETVRPVRSLPYRHLEFHGKTHIGGTRHGRRVDMTVKDGTSRVRLAGRGVAPFSVAAEGGRLVGGAGTPRRVLALLDALASAEVWEGVRIRGNGEGVVVARDSGPVGASIYHDLWLAEQLADAAAP